MHVVVGSGGAAINILAACSGCFGHMADPGFCKGGGGQGRGAGTIFFLGGGAKVLICL